jgi:hypothetical protein
VKPAGCASALRIIALVSIGDRLSVLPFLIVKVERHAADLHGRRLPLHEEDFLAARRHVTLRAARI